MSPNSASYQQHCDRDALRFAHDLVINKILCAFCNFEIFLFKVIYGHGYELYNSGRILMKTSSPCSTHSQLSLQLIMFLMPEFSLVIGWSVLHLICLLLHHFLQLFRHGLFL